MINQLKEKLEIFVACRNLPNKDFTSKTDAKVNLLIQTDDQHWVKFGETEVIL